NGETPQMVWYQPYLIIHVYSDGMIDDAEIEFRCKFTYPDSDYTNDNLIKGKEEIRKALQSPSPCWQ
ncbi:MAG: hypothetical protein MN733_36120, partial [Nitrososphaera sp.]|nr:hypothetical protein [Nitrososphaera sp.]